MIKKLIANNKAVCHIDLHKLSALIQKGDKTLFIIDGRTVTVDIHIDNALTWWTSYDNDEE